MGIEITVHPIMRTDRRSSIRRSFDRFLFFFRRLHFAFETQTRLHFVKFKIRFCVFAFFFFFCERQGQREQSTAVTAQLRRRLERLRGVGEEGKSLQPRSLVSLDGQLCFLTLSLIVELELKAPRSLCLNAVGLFWGRHDELRSRTKLRWYAT